MRRGVILDTGPLVALLNGSDTYHEWARSRVADIEPPLLTCVSRGAGAGKKRCWLPQSRHHIAS